MTEPYYQDEWVTLYHGDALENEDWRTAEVLVTDPPYGMAYVSNASKFGSSKPIEGDNDPDLRDRALALWGDKPALVFGRWDVPRPAGTRNRLIWFKDLGPGMGDLKMPWGHDEEEIYVLGNGWAGQRGSNVIRARGYSASAKGRPNHPTPKPPSLIEALLEKTPDGVIADPFVGSGATLIACRALGRRAIGVELEEEYCELTAQRLRHTPPPVWSPVRPEVRSSGWAGPAEAFDFEQWEGA